MHSCKETQLDISLGIQSPCQRMSGMSNHILSEVFRFQYHSQKEIGSLVYDWWRFQSLTLRNSMPYVTLRYYTSPFLPAKNTEWPKTRTPRYAPSHPKIAFYKGGWFLISSNIIWKIRKVHMEQCQNRWFQSLHFFHCQVTAEADAQECRPEDQDPEIQNGA